MASKAEFGFLEGLRRRAAAVAAGQVDRADEPVPAELGEVARLLQALWRSSVDGIVVSERTRWSFVEVSDSFCTLTGYTRVELLGRTPAELGLNATHVSRLSTHAPHADTDGWEGLYEGQLRRRDGATRYVEFSRQRLGERFMATIVRDVTRRHDLETELRHLAETDHLTRLCNRRKFTAEVAREIRDSDRFGDPVTLIVLDLDGLKDINDRHGHHTGDAALRAVADTIRATIRDVDVAGRLGGDEFAILLTRSDPPGGVRLITELHSTLDDIRLDTESAQQLRISVSAGAVTMHSPEDAEDLLKAADDAMYRAKRRRQRRSP